MTRDIDTFIAMRTVALEGPIYDEQTDYITIELRDFSEPTRTAVIRFWMDGEVQTVMVNWENLTDAIDSLRAETMPTDWDEALSHLNKED